MAKNDNSEKPNVEPLGFSDMRKKYKDWVLKLSVKTQQKYGIFALLAIIVLPTLATLLSLPRPLQVVLCFPAGIALFLLGLGFAFVYEKNNPSHKTMKERLSASQRIKWGITGGVILLAILISASNFLPYAFGGIIVLASALGVYNFVQRTPTEIAYYENGVLDPRDEESIRRAEQRSRKTNNRKKKVEDDE